MSALAKIKFGIFLFVIGTLMVAFAPLARSAPFVACDVVAQVTHTSLRFCTTQSGGTCTVWGAWGADTAVVTVGANKECRHDIVSAPVGNSIVQVKAIGVDPVWGRQESGPSAPFAFSRPASPTSPDVIRLVP